MPDVKWIKLTTTMFDDDKIKLIEMMPEKDTILIIWIKLLIQAGRTNASGYIYLSERIPYTDEMLATLFGRQLNSIRLALDVFERFGMIERDGQSLMISNWNKHQNTKGLEEIREQNRERVRRHRENQKLLPAFDEEKEKSSKKEKEINNKDLDIDKESNVTCNVTVMLQDKKKSQSAEEIKIPDSLNNPEFIEAWNEWTQYRKEDLKKKLTPRAVKKQLEFLEGLGSANAILSINESIKNNYTGLFPPKQQPARSGKGTGFDAMEWLKNA